MGKKAIRRSTQRFQTLDAMSPPATSGASKDDIAELCPATAKKLRQRRSTVSPTCVHFENGVAATPPVISIAACGNCEDECCEDWVLAMTPDASAEDGKTVPEPESRVTPHRITHTRFCNVAQYWHERETGLDASPCSDPKCAPGTNAGTFTMQDVAEQLEAAAVRRVEWSPTPMRMVPTPMRNVPTPMRNMHPTPTRVVNSLDGETSLEQCFGVGCASTGQVVSPCAARTENVLTPSMCAASRTPQKTPQSCESRITTTSIATPDNSPETYRLSLETAGLDVVDGETEMELMLDLVNHVPCDMMDRLTDVLQSARTTLNDARLVLEDFPEDIELCTPSCSPRICEESSLTVMTEVTDSSFSSVHWMCRSIAIVFALVCLLGLAFGAGLLVGRSWDVQHGGYSLIYIKRLEHIHDERQIFEVALVAPPMHTLNPIEIQAAEISRHGAGGKFVIEDVTVAISAQQNTGVDRNAGPRETSENTRNMLDESLLSEHMLVVNPADTTTEASLNPAESEACANSLHMHDESLLPEEKLDDAPTVDTTEAVPNPIGSNASETSHEGHDESLLLEDGRVATPADHTADRLSILSEHCRNSQHVHDESLLPEDELVASPIDDTAEVARNLTESESSETLQHVHESPLPEDGRVATPTDDTAEATLDPKETDASENWQHLHDESPLPESGSVTTPTDDTAEATLKPIEGDASENLQREHDESLLLEGGLVATPTDITAEAAGNPIKSDESENSQQVHDESPVPEDGLVATRTEDIAEATLNPIESDASENSQHERDEGPLPAEGLVATPANDTAEAALNPIEGDASENSQPIDGDAFESTQPVNDESLLLEGGLVATLADNTAEANLNTMASEAHEHLQHIPDERPFPENAVVGTPANAAEQAVQIIIASPQHRAHSVGQVGQPLVIFPMESSFPLTEEKRAILAKALGISADVLQGFERSNPSANTASGNLIHGLDGAADFGNPHNGITSTSSTHLNRETSGGNAETSTLGLHREMLDENGPADARPDNSRRLGESLVKLFPTNVSDPHWQDWLQLTEKDGHSKGSKDTSQDLGDAFIKVFNTDVSAARWQEWLQLADKDASEDKDARILKTRMLLAASEDKDARILNASRPVWEEHELERPSDVSEARWQEWILLADLSYATGA